MIIEGGRDNYVNLLTRQLYALTSLTMSELDIKHVLYDNIEVALKRMDICLSHSNMKHTHYKKDENKTYFNPLHQGQNAMFLYFLSNSIEQENAGTPMPSMISYLNKMINGIDANYTVKLPQYFFMEHPLGTILGRAHFNNGFFCLQGCTIGAANGRDPLTFPTIGENVIMLAHSSIIGNSHIGNNVIMSINSLIKNGDVPDNSIVFGQSPNVVIKTLPEDTMREKICNYWVI